MLRLSLPLLLAALALPSGAPAGGASEGRAPARPPVRTWVDKDGVFHVDDTPPPPQVLRDGRTGDASRFGSSARAWARKSGSGKKAAPWWERQTDAPPDEIDKAALLYKIPAELVRAVIAAESAGDTEAVSQKGAQGLMQLMPATAHRMYVRDSHDPAQNIQGGTRYLRMLANDFNGDMALVVAAYNAGPEAVKKYGGIPPYEETRAYVRKVMNYYRELKAESAKAAKEPGKLASAERSAPPAGARP